jgi:hypothetical protein
MYKSRIPDPSRLERQIGQLAQSRDVLKIGILDGRLVEYDLNNLSPTKKEMASKPLHHFDRGSDRRVLLPVDFVLYGQMGAQEHESKKESQGRASPAEKVLHGGNLLSHAREAQRGAGVP